MPGKITIKGDGKITISVKRRKPGTKQLLKTAKPAAADVSSGIFRTRKDPDYLARRIKKTGISFFDFGQIPTEGGFIDWDIKNLTAPEFNSELGIIPYDLEDSDWTPIVSEILALENYAAHSRLIEQLHNRLFKLQIYLFDGEETETTIDLETDARFASGSFKFTEAELANPVIGLTTNLETSIIALKDEFGSIGLNKFTNEPDFSADAVTYSIQNNDQIYIVPIFRQAGARLSYSRNTPSESGDYFLNLFYKIFPRQIFLDPASPYYDNASEVIYSWEFGGDIDETAYNQFFEAVAIQKAEPDVRGYYSFFDGDRTNGTLDPAAFPPGAYPPAPVPDLPEDFVNLVLISVYLQFNPPGGFLQAIITRGSQKFYCWKM